MCLKKEISNIIFLLVSFNWKKIKQPYKGEEKDECASC